MKSFYTKILKKLFLLYLFILVFILFEQLVYSTSWPAQGTRKVGHNYGDSESGPMENPPYYDKKFHHGCDIIPDSVDDTWLLAVKTGKFYHVWDEGLITETWTLEVPKTDGTTVYYSYCHVRRDSGPTPRGRTWVADGTKYDVVEGEELLKVRHYSNWMEPEHVCDHLDIEIRNSPITSGVENPLSILPAPVHNISVNIEKYRQHGQTWFMSDVTGAGESILWNKIDIIAMGKDEMGYAGWTPGVHKISYEVKDGPKPSARINEMFLMNWSGVLPSNSRYETVYCMGPPPCESTLNHNYYIVTNTNNNGVVEADDENQFWYTRAKSGGTWGNGVGTEESKISSEAFFPDGKYKVEIKGYEIGGTFQLNSPNNRNIVVDNFRPYVSKVLVNSTTTGDTVYSTDWWWGGFLLTFETSVRKILNNGGYTVTTEFSEPMSSATLNFSGQNISMQSDQEEGQKTIWHCDITATGVGVKTLGILGTDLAGINLVPFSASTPNYVDPVTARIGPDGAGFSRDSNGNHIGNGGADTMHRLRINIPYNFSYALCLDKSASMAGIKLSNMKTGGCAFTDKTEPNESLGVVTYSDSSSVIYNLTQMTQEGQVTIKTAIRNAINGITAEGARAIGDGLVTSANMLPTDGTGRILLISDGMRDGGTNSINAGINAANNRNVKVYTIALENNADKKMLFKIARRTGGKYYSANNIYSEQTQYSFNKIIADMRREGTIKKYKARGNLLCASGKAKTPFSLLDDPYYIVPVDEHTFEFKPMIMWDNGTHVLYLQAPDGTWYYPSLLPPEIGYVEGSNYAYYNIASPQTGDWRLFVVSAGADYIVTASSKSPELEVESYPGDAGYEFPVVAHTRIYYQGNPVTGASVTGTVTGPDDTTEDVTFYDDGNADHGDSVAGDGIYSVKYSTYKGLGTYMFEININNSNPTFTRCDEVHAVVDTTLTVSKVEEKNVSGTIKNLIGNEIIYVDSMTTSLAEDCTVIVEANTGSGWSEIWSTTTWSSQMNWNAMEYGENNSVQVRARKIQYGEESKVVVQKEIAGTTTREIFQENAGESKWMTIDNSRPYVANVLVNYQSSGITKYLANWGWDGTYMDFSILRDEVLYSGNNCNITVEFSESINSASLNIADIGNVPLSPLQPEGRTWTGNFVITGTGEKGLNIQGTDLAGNLLVPFYPTVETHIDPATYTVVSPSGVTGGFFRTMDGQIGTGGPDTLHKIRINMLSQNTTLSIRRVENKTVGGVIREIIGNPIIHVEGTLAGGSTVVVEASANGGGWTEIGSSTTLPFDLSWNTIVYPESSILRIRGKKVSYGYEELLVIQKERVGNGAIEPFQEPDGASREMLMDNYRPIAQRLTVGNNNEYQGTWTWDGGGYSFASVGGVVGNGSYPVRIILTEPCTDIRARFSLMPARESGSYEIIISTGKEAVEGEEVILGAGYKVDGEMQVNGYIWNYGDGTGEESTHEPITRHTFQASGEYEVSVRLEEREEIIRTRRIQVIKREENNEEGSIQLTYKPEEPRSGEVITFTGEVEGKDDGEEILYEWDYGDGSDIKETKENETEHEFIHGRDYIVKMKVKRGKEEIGSIAKVVRIRTETDIRLREKTTARGRATLMYGTTPYINIFVSKELDASQTSGTEPKMYRWDHGNGIKEVTTNGKTNHVYEYLEREDEAPVRTLTTHLEVIDGRGIITNRDITVTINPREIVEEKRIGFTVGSLKGKGREITAASIKGLTGSEITEKGSKDTTEEVTITELVTNDGVTWNATLNVAGIVSPQRLQFIIGDPIDPDLAGNRMEALHSGDSYYDPAIRQWNGYWDPIPRPGEDIRHALILTPGGPLGGKDIGNNKEENKVELEEVKNEVQVIKEIEIKIIEPEANKKISGNAVSVIAESSKEIEQYIYQYKSLEQNEWIEIGRSREGIYWNTSGLKEGKYQIRAISIGDNAKVESILIAVTIDKSNAEIVEEDTAIGHKKQQTINAGEGTNIAMTDGTLVIVPAMTKSNILKIEKMNTRGINESILPPVESSTKPVGIFYRCEMNGTKDIEKTITLNVPYKDEDGDGVIDGTKYKAEKVKLYYLNETTGEWKQLPTNIYSTVNKSPSLSNVSKALYKSTNIAANINKFTDRTLFGLFARVPASDLNNIIVYPNPYKPNSGLGHSNIIFDGLTENIKVRVYSISGRLAKTIEGTTDGRYEWDCKNGEGEIVASGVYLYIATNNKGEMKKGKIAIIR